MNDTTSNDRLCGRITEPEQQLAAARSAPERVEATLRDDLAYAESIVDTLREPLLVLDGELCVVTASHAFYERFGVSDEETIGRHLYDLGNGQWNIPAFRTLLEEVLPQRKRLTDFEVVHEFPGLGRRVMLLNARALWSVGKSTERVLLAIEDITERKHMEDELLRSNEDLQRFAYMAAHDLRSPLHSALALSHLLARRIKGRVEEEEYSLLAQSIESMERLAALMHDILTYAQIGNAPRHATVVPLHESLNIALANLHSHIERCGGSLRWASCRTHPSTALR